MVLVKSGSCFLLSLEIAVFWNDELYLETWLLDDEYNFYAGAF